MKNEIIAGIAVLIVAVFVIIFSNQSNKTEQSQQEMTTSTQTSTQLEDTKTAIPLDEVANHATADDCWMAINGTVYNVTTYISQHPDGNSILLGCGKDATNLYDGTDPQGTRHSRRADALLPQYVIGALGK